MKARNEDIAITIEQEPAEAVRAEVFSGLRSYNRQHAVAPDFRPLTLAARSAAGELVGGLAGDTGWSWLHVDLLWISEQHRGMGIGRALLRKAESEALTRGCLHAYLDTFDYQARPFYEREGYLVFGVQEDYPPGHERYFLRKTLA
jgi:GNAT superfamily N-acetyltransferase